MRSQRTRRRGALLASAALLLEASCGEVSGSSSPAMTDSGAAGWGGAAVMGGPADPTAIVLDTADCAARRISNCQGVESSYSSDEVFDAAPALAHCSRFNSWDGCQRLLYTFDARGCATTVAAHGPGAIDPLPELRQCLTTALRDARWPCLANGTLSYRESCFIR